MMTREEAAAFFAQYTENDCYTLKCRTAHAMGCDALSCGRWENIQEQIIPDTHPQIIHTAETCSRCLCTTVFAGTKKALSDKHCPQCGAFMLS